MHCMHMPTPNQPDRPHNRVLFSAYRRFCDEPVGTYTKPTGLHVTTLSCGCRVTWRERSDGSISWRRVTPCQSHPSLEAIRVAWERERVADAAEVA